jgi:hypothetical protein
MRIAQFLFTTCAAAGLLIAPIQAQAADSTGATGKVKALEVNSPSADTYVAYHGKVGIKTGKAGAINYYTWGGTQCQGKTISDEMVDLLMHAFKSRKYTRVTPRYKSGAGPTKCLVGIKITTPKGETVEPAPS